MMSVSISSVVVLRLASTRSYTCSMYKAGVSISTLIAMLNAPAPRKRPRKSCIAALKGLGDVLPGRDFMKKNEYGDSKW